MREEGRETGAVDSAQLENALQHFKIPQELWPLGLRIRQAALDELQASLHRAQPEAQALLDQLCADIKQVSISTLAEAGLRQCASSEPLSLQQLGVDAVFQVFFEVYRSNGGNSRPAGSGLLVSAATLVKPQATASA